MLLLYIILKFEAMVGLYHAGGVSVPTIIPFVANAPPIEDIGGNGYFTIILTA
jgi:hypothetical protein